MCPLIKLLPLCLLDWTATKLTWRKETLISTNTISFIRISVYKQDLVDMLLFIKMKLCCQLLINSNNHKAIWWWLSIKVCSRVIMKKSTHPLLERCLFTYTTWRDRWWTLFPPIMLRWCKSSILVLKLTQQMWSSTLLRSTLIKLTDSGMMISMVGKINKLWQSGFLLSWVNSMLTILTSITSWSTSVSLMKKCWV